MHVTYWTAEGQTVPASAWSWFESSLDTDCNYSQPCYQTSAHELMHKSLLALHKVFSLHDLKPSGNYIHHMLQHLQTLHAANTVYLFVLYGSHSQHHLLSQTAVPTYVHDSRRGMCSL